MRETIDILGAGSMGLLLAGYLARRFEVRLIRRAGSSAGELQLTLEHGGARRRCRLPQYPPQSLPTPSQRLLVCTKAYDALAALETLRPQIAADAEVLLMQNGMGSQQAVAAAFPTLSVYAASSTEGAYRAGAAHVVHAGLGRTLIGPLQGPAADWAGRFSAAGLEAEVATPIDWHLANKLRVNALINPLTVVHDCRNGELLERPAALEQMRRLGAETDAALAAAGYDFNDSAFAVACQVARATAANYSSMYQDARAGRRLELDYISGYLLRLGQQNGVAMAETASVYGQLASAAG